MTAHELLALGLTNAVLATLLAAGGWLLTRLWTNPHVASVVWLVVLLKLVTPPVVELPVVMAAREAEAPAERADDSPPRSQRVAGRRPSLGSDSAEPPRRQERQGGEGEAPAEPRVLHEASVPVPLFLGRGPFTGNPQGEGSDGSLIRSLHSPSSQNEGLQRTHDAAGHPLTRGPSPQGEGSNADSRDVVSSSDRLMTFLLSLWLAGSLFVAGRTLLCVVRFRRSLRRAASKDDGVRRAAERVAARLGLRCPAVVVVPADVGPMVWAGSAAPLVIVPRSLWLALGEAERETLLAHELAHVARGDHWARRLEAVVLALYWWLPTAWLAVRRREGAAESCCDALVLATYPDRPRAYAEALFAAVSIVSASRPPALASGLGRAAELKERLTMIVHDRVPARPSRAVRLGLILGAAGALVVSARLVEAEPAEEVKAVSVRDEAALYPAGDEAPAAGSPQYAAGELPGSLSKPSSAAASGLPGGAAAAPALGSAYQPENDPYGGGEDGFSPPSAGRGARMPGGFGGMMGRASAGLSAETRAKMVNGLIAVIGDADQPNEVKLRAMRSLGRIAGGLPQAAKVESLLIDAAEKAESDEVQLAAAEALHALGSPKGVEWMWALLEKADDGNTRSAVVRQLNGAGFVPPSVEAVRMLARLVARDRAEAMQPAMFAPPGIGVSAVFGGGFDGGSFEGAQSLLHRLTLSGEGIGRLVETIETTEEPQADEEMRSEGDAGAFGRMEVAPSESPVRDVLLPGLAATEPASDEIAAALVEALSSEDAGVRGAAAQALGNEPGARDGFGGMGSGAGRGMAVPTGLPVGLSRPPSIDALRSKQASSKQEAVRDKVIASLIAAAEDPKATAEARLDALRGLSRVGGGTKEAEQVLVNAFERAADDSEKLKIAELLQLQGLQRGTALMWELLLETEDPLVRRDASSMLWQRKEAAPTVEAVLMLAEWRAAAAPEERRNGRPDEVTEQIGENARLLIVVLTRSSEGLRRLLEAVPKADGEARSVLLWTLSNSSPVGDDSARVLLEALETDDAELRRAIMSALGNVQGLGANATPALAH